MKNLFLFITIASITLISCNHSSSSAVSQKNNENLQAKSQTEKVVQSATFIGESKNTLPITAIINAYLQMKNAFIDDNTTKAASTGKTLESVFKNFDKSVLSKVQKKTFEDIVDDASEHADHIGKNGGNIKHQREHFALLSKDIYELIKKIGAEQVLYEDFDPMINNGNGAYWISETKEIKNPYLGKAMLNNGTVKEIIK
jgi:hypothetical protein